jgi:hypothetical protein
VFGLDAAESGPNETAGEGTDGEASHRVGRPARAAGAPSFIPAWDEEGSGKAQGNANGQGTGHGPTLGVRALSERDPEVGDRLPLQTPTIPTAVDLHHEPPLIDLLDLSDNRGVGRLTRAHPNSVSNRDMNGEGISTAFHQRACKE